MKEVREEVRRALFYGATICDRKQTSGSDRGRQCAFKTGQTVICHVFHGL